MISALTPADCDLRDYPYLGIDIARLFDSEFHAKATDAEWRAGVTLWLKSFHQVPAASLPADDASLARLAEFARDLKSWRKVKTMALYGWQEASDGRLYHPVVAEKALEGWIEKLRQRKSSAAGTAKRYGTEYDPQPYDDAIRTAIELLAILSPHSRALRVRTATGSTTGTAIGTADDVPPASQEKGRKDKGSEGKGESQPVPIPSKEQLSNFSFGINGKNGTGKNGFSEEYTVKDQTARIGIFQKKLAPHLGSQAWKIIDAAMRPSCDEYERCLELCKAAAKKIPGNKGWPHAWPNLEQESA